MTRVQLCAGDRGLAEEFSALLRELPDTELVLSATTTAQLLESVRELDPDVVVLGEDGSGAPLVDTARELGHLVPHVAVVLVVREGTSAVLAEAMGAGARGLLVLPLSLEEVQARLVSASDWARGVRRMLGRAGGEEDLGSTSGRLLLVAGAKGGVGTTTLAVHLALACASAPQRRVCLVDLDLQTGDVGTLLNITHRRSIVDLVVAEEVSGRALDETLFAHASGVRVLLSPAEGERAEEVTATEARRVLTALRTRYDLVIVDGGSQTSDASASAVEMADEVLVPTTCDILSVRAAKRLGRLWTRLQLRKEEDLRVVLTQTSRDSELQADLARRLVALPSVRTTVPASFRALEAAVNQADPTLVDDRPFLRAVRSVATEVGVLSTAPTTPERARSRRRARGEQGQSSVELMAVLPLLLLVGVLLWQLVLIGFTWVLAGRAADDAGRRLQVGAADSDIDSAALHAVPGGWRDGASVQVRRGEQVVDVTLRTPLLLPGLRSLPVSFTGHVQVPAEP